jgi:hypothetical protein
MTTPVQNERFRVGAWSGLGFAVLFLVGAVASNVATTEVCPRPGDTPAEVQAYFADKQDITEVRSLTATRRAQQTEAPPIRVAAYTSSRPSAEPIGAGRSVGRDA